MRSVARIMNACWDMMNSSICRTLTRLLAEMRSVPSSFTRRFTFFTGFLVSS